MQTLASASLLALASLRALAQPAPAFEAASVKVAEPSTDGMIRRSYGGDAGRIDYHNVTLKGLILRAFRVKEHQVTGPDWLDSAGYDIVATIPRSAAEAQVPEMLQALLSERFRLALRHETRDLPVYALVVSKSGPKLKPVEQEAGFSMRMSPKGRHPEGKSSVSALCSLLSRTLDRPVVDMTELKGVYDMVLDWAPDDSERGGMIGMKMALDTAMSGGAGGAPPAGAGKGPENVPDATDGASLFTALQERLGLKLEQRKLPTDFLVVDRAEKVPVDN